MTELTIPKITKKQFLSLTPEKQKEYLRLFQTQVVPCLEVFRNPAPYKISYGGRGSGKSWSFASLLSQKLTAEKHNLLCCREIQKSLEDSSYKLLVETIERLNLKGWVIKKDTLENENGSRVIFRGLKDLRAGNAIKSLEGYDLAWLEEAQAISLESLQLLLPTIRMNGSEIWACYNPNTEEDAIEMLKQREGAISVKCNWSDNPWFTERLAKEREADYKFNPELARHIWEGEYLAQADNAVMSRLVVHEAMEREVDSEGDYQIAVDVARYGSDSSIISVRKGLKMIDLKEYKNISLVELCGHIEVIAGNNHDMTIKVDETGVGGGVVDILQGRGYRNVIGINFGSKPQDTDKFADLPSEMWCTFPISDVSLLNDSGLFHELTDRRFSYDHKARRQVESKDSYKARNGGKSPDKADSVLMLYYEPKIIRPMLY
ncbi:MAG: PBSX family phage terminase large subunit [Methanobrevibacter sp.]|nr:PBSX family phage terminase large subunit [Methanobrevibacter sp.]